MQRRGSRWRRLHPGRQALLVVAYLRKGEIPALPGSRHDIAAREHGILGALDTAQLSRLADTGCYRPSSQNQKEVSTDA